MNENGVQNLRAILFDLDGTLVATRPEYRYQIVGNTLREFGRSAKQAHVDMFWFGSDRDETIRALFEVDPSLFWPVFARHDVPHIRAEHTTAFADIAVLGQLRQRGLQLGVVTNAPRHIAYAELALIGAHLFDVVVVADLARGIRPKPMPDGILACLDRLGAPPQNAWFVGNAHEDIEAARAAGVKDIHIDRSEHPLPRGCVRPSASVASLEALLELD